MGPDDQKGIDMADDGARGDLRWASVPALLRDAADRFAGADAVVDGSIDGPG